jgi:glycosyltransferase involved in cell wall biosynthesis
MSASILIDAFAEHQRPASGESRQERHPRFNPGFPAHTNASNGDRYSFMLRNRIYYWLKPFVPQFLRRAIRRKLAMRLRKRTRDVWPIMPGSELAPGNWPGWPEGKKFALVLTHDVESKKGLSRCRSLMQLESDLGFRSSFNFIPEGSYRVPAELREELTARGFEVGIHDLKHDGHLFSSSRKFKLHAANINSYAREWGASGFRAGFMLRHLDWLHALDVQYDASTFDTDPFEPQPDGGHTIFPYWVPRPGGNSSAEGYVELPYTLPQDSTLFLVLRETTPEIWMRKLDWIAEHGGMALIDVHPDYISFDGSGQTATKYPVELYRQFLTYVKTKYAGDYWQPLPREVAVMVRQSKDAVGVNGDRLQISPRLAQACEISRNGESARQAFPSLRDKRGAVLLFSYYPADPRPRRAAEALVREGAMIDLICLQKNRKEPRREILNGVRVFRVPVRRRRSGKITYIWQYSTFILRSFLYLTFLSIFRRYDFVHVHNMPDVLIFGALVPKALGAKIVLDLHDPMPELMMSIYNLDVKNRFVRWLKRLEKLSVSFADLVLTPNKAFQELFISRSCPSEKIEVVMNCPENTIFDPSKYDDRRQASANGEKPFKIMYHGLIAERHGLDTALEAIAKLQPMIPTLEFHIFGEPTPYMKTVDSQVQKLLLQNCVYYHGYQPQIEIAKSIRSIDLGIIPNRRSPFTELNMPTRIFEYLAMGRPVIVPNTRGIRDYFGNGSALFFEPGDPESLGDAILDVYRNPQKAESILTLGKNVYETHRWEVHRVKFLDRISDLLSAVRCRSNR